LAIGFWMNVFSSQKKYVFLVFTWLVAFLCASSLQHWHCYQERWRDETRWSLSNPLTIKKVLHSTTMLPYYGN